MEWKENDRAYYYGSPLLTHISDCTVDTGYGAIVIWKNDRANKACWVLCAHCGANYNHREERDKALFHLVYALYSELRPLSSHEEISFKLKELKTSRTRGKS